MKTTSNKDFLNAVRNQASDEYKERVPMVTGDIDARAVEQVFNSYPTAKNEFIKTLTEKVVRSEFFSRVYENPLKMLKKGSEPYGGSIEELFVVHAKVKGFLKKYTASSGGHTVEQCVGNHDADALLNFKPADVRALYITRNYQYVYEVSISDAQLKSAFTSANGLSELVNQLVGSLTSGAELQEFEDMKMVLKAAAEGQYISQKDDGTTQLSGAGGKYINSTNSGVKNAMKVVMVPEDAPGSHTHTKGLAKQLRAYAQKLRFMKTDCNMAGVPTFSDINDLVFLTTPEYQAEMDVELLANTFNISKAEAAYRTIIVDELPEYFLSELSTNGTDVNNKYWNKDGQKGQSKGKVACMGMLIDRNFLQVIDTVNESRTFDNGRALMTNIFLHRQGYLANCYFANAVAFIATGVVQP